MSLLDRVIVVVMLALQLVSAGMVVWIILRERRLPDDPGNRLTYGWLGAFALTALMVCSVGLSVIVAQFPPTRLAVLVAAIVNGLSQPIAMLIVWMGARKIVRGILGKAEYAGQIIDGASRGWVFYSGTSGVVFLISGIGFMAVLAWPILRWVSPSFP